METQTKFVYVLFLLGLIFAVLHNVIYGIFGVEEGVFFSLSLLSFLAFLILIFYDIFTFTRKGRPKDIWKIGFMGLFGLVALIPDSELGFFVFFVFFIFFGLRK